MTDDAYLIHVPVGTGANRVVDELLVRCTHSRVMDHWLPGIAPTGVHIDMPHVVVTGFRGDKITYEHVYWDEASLLAQIGLVDGARLPLLGVEQGRNLEQETASNVLIERAERAEEP